MMYNQNTNVCKQPSLFENSFWDIKKTAEVLSICVGTLRDWVYKRQIPFKKVGNLIRFVPSEIQKWIEERSQHVD